MTCKDSDPIRTWCGLGWLMQSSERLPRGDQSHPQLVVISMSIRSTIILRPIHFAMSICIPRVPVSSSSVAIREHECHSLMRKTHRNHHTIIYFYCFGVVPVLISCAEEQASRTNARLRHLLRYAGKSAFLGEYTSSRDCSIFLVFIWDFFFQQTSGTPFLLGSQSRDCLFLGGPVCTSSWPFTGLSSSWRTSGACLLLGGRQRDYTPNIFMHQLKFATSGNSLCLYTICYIQCVSQHVCCCEQNTQVIYKCFAIFLD